MGHDMPWICRYPNNCVFCCSNGNPDVCGKECYMTTDPLLQVDNIYTCDIRPGGVIAISYLVPGIEKDILMNVVQLINGHELIDFLTIHRICTDQRPGPKESKWPLVWTGLVQIDDDKLTFEFIEKRDTDD